MMETGEVIRSDASPDGYGQKMQRPGQPLPNGNEGRMARPAVSHRRPRKQAELG
jgi:hypothetical protein